jgi:hypothetical protein
MGNVGLKVVREDLGSITEVHGRVFYPRDVWIDVPGNGAYVAMTGGLFSAGDGAKCIYLEGEGIVRAPGVEGVLCFSKVRHIAPCPERLDASIRHLPRIWESPPDQGLLADLAKTAADWRVRKAAAQRLEDQGLLADLAKTDADWRVRKAAAQRLEDQGLLADLAKTDADWRVRQAAAQRLEVLSVLQS